ncbi:MAG: hypothetical protein AMXMBFR26_09520 [Porticoccaceae bacterium]
MSCVLRVSGEALDVDALLSEVSLQPDKIWRNGESRFGGKIESDSGANFLVSEADLNQFDVQLQEATEFLEQQATVVAKIASFPGVESAVLDFGIEVRAGFVAQFDHLPRQFIQAAVKAGISVELSHYVCSEDEEIQEQESRTS